MPQQSGVTFSNPFLHRDIDVFDSLGQALEPSATVIPKTHFVEWFSGSAIDSIWTVFDNVGVGSSAMIDGVNEGFQIQPDNIVGSQRIMHFNNIHHYAHNGSVIIAVTRILQTTLFNAVLQLSATSLGLETDAITVGILTTVRTDNFNVSSEGNNDGGSSADSGVTLDTAFHTWKMEVNGTDFRVWNNGDLVVTKTSNLPAVKLQPSVFTSSRVIGVRQYRIRYLEAYNT